MTIEESRSRLRMESYKGLSEREFEKSEVAIRALDRSSVGEYTGYGSLLRVLDYTIDEGDLSSVLPGTNPAGFLTVFGRVFVIITLSCLMYVDDKNDEFFVTKIDRIRIDHLIQASTILQLDCDNFICYGDVTAIAFDINPKYEENYIMSLDFIGTAK